MQLIKEYRAFSLLIYGVLLIQTKAWRGQIVQCGKAEACYNGGLCYRPDDKTARCLCQLGYTGFDCQDELITTSPQFSGRSYISIRQINQPIKHNLTTTIHLSTQTSYQNSIILYMGYSEGEFLAVCLYGQKIILRYNLGAGIEQVNQSFTGDITLIQFNIARGSVWLAVNGKEKVTVSSSHNHVELNIPIHSQYPVIFIGGHNSARSLYRSGVDTGYKGCIYRLIINERDYRLDYRNYMMDEVQGLDIRECQDSPCSKPPPCQSESRCIPVNSTDSKCECKMGYTGDRCELAVRTYKEHGHYFVPEFTGYSFVTYPTVSNSISQGFHLKLNLKFYQPTGLLFYIGAQISTHASSMFTPAGDYLSLYLINGSVSVQFNLGGGSNILRSREVLQKSTWYTVSVDQVKNYTELRVDNVAVRMNSTSKYKQLNIKSYAYLGGYEDYDLLRIRGLDLQSGLRGCINHMELNDMVYFVKNSESGRNINLCPHACYTQQNTCDYRCKPIDEDLICDCNLGFSGETCSSKSGLIHMPLFNGNSYLMYTDKYITDSMNSDIWDIRLGVLPRCDSGCTVLWMGQPPHIQDDKYVISDYFHLSISHTGHLIVQFNLGGGSVKYQYESAENLNNGQWHRIRVHRNKEFTTVKVDSNILEQLPEDHTEGHTVLNAQGGLLLGTAPAELRTSDYQPYKGIIRSLQMKKIDLTGMRLIQYAISGSNVEHAADVTFP